MHQGFCDTHECCRRCCRCGRSVVENVERLFSVWTEEENPVDQQSVDSANKLADSSYAAAAAGYLYSALFLFSFAFSKWNHGITLKLQPRVCFRK